MVLGKQIKNNVHLSKVGVGEIDTSSPFESVKHAVSIFGAAAFARRTQLSGKKRASQSSEKLSVKELRLHLAEKELNKLKENLRQTDSTTIIALAELEKTKKNLKELNGELSVVSKSRDAADRETEILNNHIDQEKNSDDGTPDTWGPDMERFRVQYLAAALELNAAKQELGKVRQDYDSASRTYNSVLKQSSAAKAASKASDEAAAELSGKIYGMKELIKQAALEFKQAAEEKTRIESSRELLGQEHKIKLDGLAKTLEDLKKNQDPETAKKLQRHLESDADQREALKHEVLKAKDSYSESARMISSEIDIAKATLQRLVNEESSLRCLIESLKLELENMKKNTFELNEKEAEAKHFAQDLEAELQKSKWELQMCMADESKVRSTYVEMMARRVELLAGSQGARQDVEDIKLKREAVMKGAKANGNSIREYETNLQLLLQKLEAARSAEAEALERMKLMGLPESKDSGAKITLSKEEFNSLSIKIKDSATTADIKVSVATVQVEAVRARQNDSRLMLEASQKELEEIKLATAEALRIAEEAEIGTNELEGELLRLGHRLHITPAGIRDVKTDCESEMEPSSYAEGINRSYSTRSANRRRMTLGEILKLEREGCEKPIRALMRSLSGTFPSI